MGAIADALVYAVSYIYSRPPDDDDDDAGVLESIAGLVARATPAEQDALAAAAGRALAAELASPRPRPEFVSDYSRWMADLFGDGWDGNRRVILD